MRVRFVGRGHPDIRATHGKTLELSIDADITARATCVIAVDVHADAHAHVAGPVRIDISAGEESATVHALANSSWQPGDAAVIRRGVSRLPGTLATHADMAAADLPRGLIDTLRHPDATVEVTVTRAATTHRTIVLFALDPSVGADDRLRAEQDAADVVVVEDADARRIVGPQQLEPPTDKPQRVLVVAARDVPGARVLDALPDASIETVGLSADLAAAAASSSRGPLTIATDRDDPNELLRATPSTHRLVLTTSVSKLAELLERAQRIRGACDVVLVQQLAPPVRVRDGVVPELGNAGAVHVCFGQALKTATALDPGVRAAISALLADGVPTRTAAKALSALTGMPKREAYDLVLTLTQR